MSHRIGICQQVIRGRDGLDDLVIAAAAGFDWISLHSTRDCGLPPERWRSELAAAGLRAAGVMAIRGILEDPADAEDVVRAAAIVGASYVVVTTGPLGGRDRASADAACAAWFQRMQPLADSSGVRLALEPLHPLLGDQSYVHTFGHALEIIGDNPGAGVVVDTGHLWWDLDLLGDVGRGLGAVVSVQVADVDAELLAKGRYDRVELGTGAVPNHELLPALVDCGYVGTFELETLARRDGRASRLRDDRRRICDWLVGPVHPAHLATTHRERDPR